MTYLDGGGLLGLTPFRPWALAQIGNIYGTARGGPGYYRTENDTGLKLSAYMKEHIFEPPGM